MKQKRDLADNIQLYITHFLRLTLIIAIFIGIYNQRWSLSFFSLLILLMTYLPLFFEKKYKIYLPIEFEFIIIVFIYASIFLGEIRGYYTTFWWWDVLLHTSSGIALGFVGFLLMYILYYKDKITSKPIWIVIFSFCFALALGALWEVFEFSMDSIFGFNMQKNGLVDTMWDLIVDAVGAFIVSFIGYFYLKGRNYPLFTRLFKKFKKENPKYFRKING